MGMVFGDVDYLISEDPLTIFNIYVYKDVNPHAKVAKVATYHH